MTSLHLLKKAISLGVSAALLASLVATAVAPSTFASAPTLTVTPATSAILSGGGPVNLAVSGSALTPGATVSVTSAPGAFTLTSGVASELVPGSGVVSVTGTYTYTNPSATSPAYATITVTDSASDTTAYAYVAIAPAGASSVPTIGSNDFLTAYPGTSTANGANIVEIDVNPFGKSVGTVPGTLVLTTSAGLFQSVSTTNTIWSSPTITSPYGTSTSAVSGTTNNLQGNATVYLRAPTTANPAVLVQLTDTPNPGSPQTLDTVVVSFAASTTTPTAIAFPVGPNPATIGSSIGGSPSAMEVAVADTSAGYLPNQAVTVTVSAGPGYLGTNGSGLCTSNATPANGRATCTIVTPDTHSGADNPSNYATVYLYGGGVAGLATITFASSSLTATETVSLGGGGLFATLVVNQGRFSLPTNGALTLVGVITPETASGTAIQLTSPVPAFAGGVAVSPSIFSGSPSIDTSAYGSFTMNGTSYTGYPLYASCGATAGTATITISAKNTSIVPTGTITASPITISCANAAASFTVTPSATSVVPGGTVTLTVKVVDSANIPVPDGTTTVTMSTNVGSVTPAGGGSSATTSNGSATFYFIAPSTAGTANLLAFVSGLSAPQSATITVGSGSPPPVVVWAPTTSALGNTLVGPFSFATKIQTFVAPSNYITWKVDGGVALANQTLQIWVYKKRSAHGIWTGPTLLTTRRANARGIAYLNIRSGNILWLSLRPVLPATGTTPARWGPTSIGRWR